MALVACRECGMMVSTEAISCPECGCPAPAGGASTEGAPAVAAVEAGAARPARSAGWTASRAAYVLLGVALYAVGVAVQVGGGSDTASAAGLVLGSGGLVAALSWPFLRRRPGLTVFVFGAAGCALSVLYATMHAAVQR